ncbi:MAG TPA: hypothetical protein VM848_06410, partial [Acidimicrobiia bacterium]|nr:hypothetical protein [Acidimicrobiia bacterium]
TGWSAAGSWETPANSSVTHLVLGGRGPLIVDYSSAIHLESLQLESPQSKSAKLESAWDDARHEPGKELG